MRARLFACLLAGALIAPQTAVNADAGLEGVRLPPIAYAETIPWMTGDAERKAPSYLGLLLAPKPLTAAPTGFAAAPLPDAAALYPQLAGIAPEPTGGLLRGGPKS